ncbi:hypothetical protein LHU53_13190 [Rhodoferax sp. U2-2l]|uniref:hypothetical protein n=1 Tax=Rhodoferax sp. U2-2l TaxID=2884000 RepID=UPI001D0A553D|nr:hypothetical protein [Rhodoferax sp. U2-2l]MCB8747860.1 hypothetical protein [Rhodoferax sp. U2-2l]
MAYDENLLERSRTQWQFGDWASLAALQRDTLQHHPDRAKLALLCAAGHQALGNAAEARQHTRLAIDWGCSKKLVSQVLISGVYNTLGCAAAINGQENRAIRHFQAAMQTGAAGSDVRLLTQARVGHQLTQLGLVNSASFSAAVLGALPSLAPLQLPPLSKGFEEIGETLAKQKVDLDAQLKKQADELIRMRKFIDASLKKEVANATKQIEAAVGLQSYFATGELPNINIERHSWPISPDFALYLIQLLETYDYDVIIEFGSGISTVIVAKTLAKMAGRRQPKPPVVMVSFDHLEPYYQQTLAQLNQAGLADSVQLELAPLQPYTAPNGNTYPYYTCQAALAALAAKHPPKGQRVLVLVDGPPASTGKHARYPAAPAVLAAFAGAQIDFLLDDYIRDDEKEISALWQAEFSGSQIKHTTAEIKLEKDACLIRTGTL